MMLNRLVTNATVSVLQTLVSGLVLLVLYRYLIDHLGAQQIGLWSVILAGTSVARLSDMGLTGSVFKFVARYTARGQDNQAAMVVQTAVVSIAVIMAALIIVAYPWLSFVLQLVVPAGYGEQAAAIVPWAVFSLWIGGVGGVFQSGLDGCQRMDLRNIVTMASSIVFLALAVWLVPRYGLIGLAIGQVSQGTMVALANWLVLRHQLAIESWVPMRWSKQKFVEMLGYSVNFQINSISVLLFDPAIRVLMSHYGGLASAGYYEMANQFVTKLRALITAANQALAPAIAGVDETHSEKLRGVYLSSYNVVFFVSIPLYAALWISMPVVSALWIGHMEEQFILFGAVLAVGWGVNTLMGPAYFMNLGTGNLKWNTISHITMALLNILLGAWMGRLFGGLGVATGAMIALAIGSLLPVYILHRQYKISFGAIVPEEHRALSVIVTCGVAVCSWINTSTSSEHGAIMVGAVSICVYVALVATVGWFHPYRSMVVARRRSASSHTR